MCRFVRSLGLTSLLIASIMQAVTPDPANLASAKGFALLMVLVGNSPVVDEFDECSAEVCQPVEHVTKNLVHKIGDSNSGEQLQAKHWQWFARESGLNPKQVLDRVSTLAKSAISEVAAAEFEVAAMPAGGHPILSQMRQAIVERGRVLLEQLQEGVAGEPINAEDSAPA